MKNKFMAAAAVVAILTATGAARADDSVEIQALKAQSAALKKQNADLEARLNKIERQQAQVKTNGSAVAPESFTAAAADSAASFLTGEGPLTWKGITVFGTIDAGLGYATHGMPINSNLYLGNNFIGRSANHAYFGISPNNLGQTTLGIKGSEEILPGINGVFWASTGFNPQSGRLANAPGSLVDANGVNRLNQSINADGSRGGQAFNDQLYVGLSSKTYGQLTFGRHKSLANDLVGAYDPAGAAYAFSMIGYSGTPVAGFGVTSTARWDNSFKYRLEYGPVRFGAIYKFADGNSGSNVGTFGGCYNGKTYSVPTFGAGACPAGYSAVGAVNYKTNNYAYQFDLGASYAGFDADVVAGYYNQAVNSSALSSAQLNGVSTFTPAFGAAVTSYGNNAGTLAGTASDNFGLAVGLKYTWNAFKFFGGYAYVNYANPKDQVGIGAESTQGGYTLSSVNNNAYVHNKVLQTQWIGVKYAYDPKTDLTLAYYHQGQGAYGANYAANWSCGQQKFQNAQAGTCSGQANAVSAFVDYHFTKRFDAYAGLMVSTVSGGLSNGYFYYTNWAPTAGIRYVF
jgi:predicted porin